MPNPGFRSQLQAYFLRGLFRRLGEELGEMFQETIGKVVFVAALSK